MGDHEGECECAGEDEHEQAAKTEGRKMGERRANKYELRKNEEGIRKKNER